MSDENQANQVPLIDLLRSVPRDLRVEFPIQWSEDGLHEAGHRLMPAGRYMHEAADRIAELEAERDDLRAELAEWELDI